MKRNHYGKVVEKWAEPGQFLIPEWMNRLLEESEEEEDCSSWPIKLLDRNSREILWKLSTLLNANKNRNGVEAQACRVLERYLAVKFRCKINQLQMQQNESFADVNAHWEEFKSTIREKLTLLIVSSIQLAAKMCHSGVQLTVKKIRNKLLSRGIWYTETEIREGEIEVYKTLDFRLPMWTSLEIAEMLANEVNMCNSKLYQVVDYAELIRNDIENELRKVSNVSNTISDAPALRTLHLSAACVAACARIFSIKDEKMITRLTQLTKAPALFITCVSNIIIKLIAGDDAGVDAGDDAGNCSNDSDTTDDECEKKNMNTENKKPRLVP